MSELKAFTRLDPMTRASFRTSFKRNFVFHDFPKLSCARLSCQSKALSVKIFFVIAKIFRGNLGEVAETQDLVYNN